MNSPDHPPSWVPTLTQEIDLGPATTQVPVGQSPVNPFPSSVDEARLCMMVTDQLLAQLPDLIRATVRAHLQQSPISDGAPVAVDPAGSTPAPNG
jgi:hypothetical protein